MIRFALTLALLMTVPAAAQPAPAPPRAGFALVVLKKDWEQLHLGYAGGPALAQLRTVALDDALFTAEAGDLEEYRWASSTAVLTPAATARLMDALAGSGPRAEGIRRLSALKGKLGHGNELDRALYTRAFVVLLGGERLYGGIFLDPPSQMAIGFPVARAAAEDGRCVIHFLPVHLPFFDVDPVGDGGAKGAGGTPDGGEVPKGMTEHFRNAAMEPTAVEHRKLLRDARLRAWLERAGKLKER